MSDYHYSWRDIGLGSIRREEPMPIIGNFDFMKEQYREPKGCEICGVVLTYSDKIKKSFCTRCGRPLTEEDRMILSGADKDAPREIDEIGATSSTIATGDSGATAMKRGGNSDKIARQEEGNVIGTGFIQALPSRRKQNNPNSILDENDGTRRVMERQGAYLTHSEVKMPTPGVDVKETYDAGTWHAMNEREYYYRRRNYGRGLDFDNQSSGLKVG
jgi:hypothetical protein